MPASRKYSWENLRRLIGLYLIASSFAVVISAVFFTFGLDLTSEQGRIVLFRIAPLTLPVVLIIDLPLIVYLYWPIHAFFRDPAHAGPETMAKAMARAANLPMLTFLKTMVIHLPAALVPSVSLLLLSPKIFGIEFFPWQIAVATAMSLVVASWHAMLEYGLVVRYSRKILNRITSIIPDEIRNARKGIVRTASRQRMVLTALSLVVFPQVVIGGSAVYRFFQISEIAPSIPPEFFSHFGMWILFAVTIISGFSILIATMLARGFSEPVHELADSMRLVEEGSLGVRLSDVRFDEFSDLFRSFNRMCEGLEERETMREKFGKYMPPEVIEKMMHEDMHLGGSLMEISALFCDIRNYSYLMDHYSPQEVVLMLNDCFTEMHEAIWASTGVVDKHLGDAILALYGSPFKDMEHRKHAIEGAMGILQGLKRFNDRQLKGGRPPFKIGIGIASGVAMVGNIGSAKRLEFTAIGNVVNQAQRLQDLTKELGCTVLISESTWLLTQKLFDFEAMGPQRLRGQSSDMLVFSLGTPTAQ